MTILTRRSFFGLLAAPAIVKAMNLMPVKAWPEIVEFQSPVTLSFDNAFGPGAWRRSLDRGAGVLIPGRFKIDGILMTSDYIAPDPGCYTEIIIPSKPDWGPSTPGLALPAPPQIHRYTEADMEAIEEEERIRNSWRGLWA